MTENRAIFKVKTILTQCKTLGKENMENLIKLLQKSLYLRAAAVIFIVLIIVFLAQSIAGSFGDYAINEEDETTRKSSFFYASQYLNPEEVIIEESYVDSEYFDDSGIILQDSALLSNSSPSIITGVSNGERNGIITYEVQSGDIPSQIAAAFGISTNSLLWANNLSLWDHIKPGQKLVILPVSGIVYKIKKGDTLDKIVKTYKGDSEKTIDFNGLPADGALAIGQEIIIPDGQSPTYNAPAKSTRVYASYDFERPYAKESHQFPWGQCTWYIAQRRYIPWDGNAKTWLYKAPQYGFEIGNEPKLGAIMVTKENRAYGHVAYVESIDGNYVTISEMSLGHGVKQIRTLHKDDWRIIGYIY